MKLRVSFRVGGITAGFYTLQFKDHSLTRGNAKPLGVQSSAVISLLSMSVRSTAVTSLYSSLVPTLTATHWTCLPLVWSAPNISRKPLSLLLSVSLAGSPQTGFQKPIEISNHYPAFVFF